MIELSNKAKLLNESSTLAFNEKAKLINKISNDVIFLTLGESNFDTFDNIKKAAINSIIENKTSFYTNSSGLTELKIAIKNYVKTNYNCNIGIDQIVAGTGAKFLIYSALMCTINPGDEIIIPTPCWVSYIDQVNLVGGIPITVECTNNFKINVSDLEKVKNNKTKVLILNNPCNPTGSVYTKDELLAISDWAIKNNILIISDEIYSKLVYNVDFHSLYSLSESIKNNCIIINGVSKTYCMTGWRVGFAYGNKTIINAMHKFISQTTSSLTTVSQYAAIEALNGNQKYFQSMYDTLKSNLNIIYKQLLTIPGFEIPNKPEGTFYIFINVEKAMKIKKIDNVDKFCELLLEKCHVAVMSGTAFKSKNYIRICFAKNLNEMLEAIHRIYNFMHIIEK